MIVNARRKKVEFDEATARQITEKIQQARRAGKRIAFAYDRVSSDHQGDGMSLDYQSDNAAGYARRAKLEVVHYFTVIESASKQGRKIFNYMLDMALGFGVKNVIFKSTDRMSRNYNDLVRIENLMDKSGFQIHFYQSGTILNDKASSSDRFMLGIELAVAKHWSDKIGQDVRQANFYKMKKGLAPQTLTPYGYIYDKKNRRHLKDPQTEKNVRFIFDEYDKGDYTLYELARVLNEKGISSPKGMAWSQSSVHRILTAPFYCGYFLYKGDMYKGNHEGYSTKKRYDARLKALKERTTQANRIKRKYRYGKFVKCSCGKTLSCMGRGKPRYQYLRTQCSHGKTFLPETTVDKMLDDEVARIQSQFTSCSFEFLKEILKRTAERQSHGRGSELAHSEKLLAKLEKRTSKLLDLFSDGDLNQDSLRRKMSELETQSEHARETRLALSYDYDALIKNIAKTADRVQAFPTRYLAATRKDRTGIAREFIEHVVWDRKTLRLVWKKPYAAFMTPEFQTLLVDIELYASRMRPGKNGQPGKTGPTGIRSSRSSESHFFPESGGATLIKRGAGGAAADRPGEAGAGAGKISRGSGGAKYSGGDAGIRPGGAGAGAGNKSRGSGGAKNSDGDAEIRPGGAGAGDGKISRRSGGAKNSDGDAEIRPSGAARPGYRAAILAGPTLIKFRAGRTASTSDGASPARSRRGRGAEKTAGPVGATITADQAAFIVEKFCKKFASARTQNALRITIYPETTIRRDSRPVICR